MLIATLALTQMAAVGQSTADAQQYALYRYVLDNTIAQRRQSLTIGVDPNTNAELIEKLRRIEPKLARAKYDAQEARISIEHPIVVEDRILPVRAAFFGIGPEHKGSVSFDLVLTKREGKWLVRRAPQYETPPAMLAAAITGLIGKRATGRSRIYVESSEDVLRILRKTHPRLEPVRRLKELLSRKQAPAPWSSIEKISVVSLDRTSARVWMTSYHQVYAGDVSYESTGSVFVWKSGHRWMARRIDDWTGE